MALGTSVQVTHKFISGKADGGDGTLIQPSKWNQAENFGAGSDGQAVVRDSSVTEGASWVDAAAAYQVRGLVGANNAVTPNTKYDLAADLVLLRDPTLKYGQVKTATGTITNDTGLAGPAANGRDVAGAFSSSTWIHFYFIAKRDGTLATLASAAAPPTGPALPTDYTLWAYAGAVRYNATPLLVKTKMRGAWMQYEGFQAVLTGGAATSETSVSLTAFVPPNALQVQLGVRNEGIGSAQGQLDQLSIRVTTGVDFYLLNSRCQITGAVNDASSPIQIPNVSQAVLYGFINFAQFGTSHSAQINVHSYNVPNGDS